jgi:crossover junction endodeoxyribonuclease RuvC
MKVIGLDLSLTGTGLVVLDSTGKVHEAMTISSKLRDMERLAYIRGIIGQMLTKHDPRLACLEGYSMGSRAGQLASIGELGGVVKLLLHRNKYRYAIAAPTQLKKFASGKGNCMKDEIMMHVFKRWGYEAKDNNQSDAYVLARIALGLEGMAEGLTVPMQEVIKAMS